jgi:hypothetical protein
VLVFIPVFQYLPSLDHHLYNKKTSWYTSEKRALVGLTFLKILYTDYFLTLLILALKMEAVF